MVIDLEKILDPQYGRLVKKFTNSPRTGVSIELYDSQAAVTKLLEASGAFRNVIQNLNLDVGALSDEQLERIARGENPIAVMATGASSGGNRETPAGEGESGEDPDAK
jgi:hypothetical protein